jgi:phosphatidylserine/phosphatidylglycerophosphate/cardiolipin synthase-like enzyme
VDASLIQSVPDETAFAQPGLSFTEDSWIEMIRGARESIDLAQMYLCSKPGQGIERVMTELERAGSRGVRVRLLLSTLMLSEDPAALARMRAVPGAEVVTWDLSRITGGILHAKYIIVDRAEFYLGSANFDWRALSHIHELGLRIRAPGMAAELGRVFDQDLRTALTGRLPDSADVSGPGTKSPPGMELVASPASLNPPGMRAALPALLELIASARHDLGIQLLTGGWRRIDDALREAAARGVRVQLMVSDWNTVRPEIDELKELSRTSGIQIRIVSIPRHSSGFIPYARVIHGKYMIVDGATLWLGTSNWSADYFEASRNVELILRDTPLCGPAQEIFRRIWDSTCAQMIDLSRAYVPPRLE